MLDAALLVVFVGAVPIGLGAVIYDHATRAAARTRAERIWTQMQPVMVAHLKQGRPLEYGAVWATHSGLVCGLINGWGSFGGLSGMTPFYVWKAGKPVFAPEVSVTDFAPGWRDCATDAWIELVKGSMETGWCATRQGAKTCKMMSG
ncbi:hypothetical protein [Caulobacter sp. S45]|uniref:hypothetical protein n=1 Tax=Caulobacter sp. S45 TaxID=1641861 RepID=UPI00131E6798|nr:hypothetical protein [Caulobacter sp. S45]